MTNKYRPLGTKVLLRVLPPKNESSLVLPDGKGNPNEIQTFEVVAVGGSVNDEKFNLNAGEVVIISAHQSQMIGVHKEDKLLLVDRENVVLAIDERTLN